MADFFGDILSSFSDVGDDVAGFFDSGLGKSLVSAGSSMLNGTGKNKMSQYEAGKIAEQNFNTNMSSGYSRESTVPNPSEDYSRIEREWFERLHRFSGLDSTNTQVKLGAK